jgi:hypothetical protein
MPHTKKIGKRITTHAETNAQSVKLTAKKQDFEKKGQMLGRCWADSDIQKCCSLSTRSPSNNKR